MISYMFFFVFFYFIATLRLVIYTLLLVIADT